jgi:hypothetical protein
MYLVIMQVQVDAWKPHSWNSICPQGFIVVNGNLLVPYLVNLHLLWYIKFFKNITCKWYSLCLWSTLTKKKLSNTTRLVELFLRRPRLTMHIPCCLLKGNWSLLKILLRHNVIDIWGRNLGQVCVCNHDIFGCHKSLQKKWWEYIHKITSCNKCNQCLIFHVFVSKFVLIL